MRIHLVLALTALLTANGCGSDEEKKTAAPLPKCLSDAKLSGGVSVDAMTEYECGDGVSYTHTAQAVSVELRLPGDTPGVIEARLFGLDEDTPAGTSLSAGLQLTTGIPPTEVWQGTFDTGGACSATIDAQVPEDALKLTLVSASLTCSAQLVSATTGTQPVTVERLNVRGLYGP